MNRAFLHSLASQVVQVGHRLARALSAPCRLVGNGNATTPERFFLAQIGNGHVSVHRSCIRRSDDNAQTPGIDHYNHSKPCRHMDRVRSQSQICNPVFV